MYNSFQHLFVEMPIVHNMIVPIWQNSTLAKMFDFDPLKGFLEN